MILLPLLACALSAGAAPAQGSGRDRFAPIEGAEFRGTLEAIAGGEVSARLPGGELRRIELDRLAEIELGAAGAAPAPPGADTLWLRSGLVLPAVFEAAADGAGRFALPFARGPLELPWRFVQGVRFDAQGPLHPGFAAAVAAPPEATDLLYARRDDGDVVRVSVEFLGVEGDRVRVRFSGQEQTIPLARVWGMVFGRLSGVRPDRLPNPRVRLVLRTGHEFPGAVVRMDLERCRLRLDEGVELDLPAAAVARLRVQSDRLAHLTDLEPELEQTPALDRVWPPLRDRGPGGGAIRLGGRNYERGLVLFPRTRLTYAIDGRYDLFEVTVGLEERAGPAAHAVLRVLGDGRVLFDSGPVTPRSEPRALQLDVAGVRRLALEADFGDNLDLGDVCAFAAPRLLVK